MKGKLFVVLTAIVLLFGLMMTAYAVHEEKPSETVPPVPVATPESQAVRSGAAKAVFDVRIGQPLGAANHLALVHQTYKDLEKAGKRPEFAVVFIGPSVKLVSTDRKGFAGNDIKPLDDIARTVSAMTKDGVRVEICMVAAKAFHVDPASVLPEIRKVPNGWISLIEYQIGGYALVPAY